MCSIEGPEIVLRPHLWINYSGRVWGIHLLTANCPAIFPIEAFLYHCATMHVVVDLSSRWWRVRIHPKSRFLRWNRFHKVTSLWQDWVFYWNKNKGKGLWEVFHMRVPSDVRVSSCADSSMCVKGRYTILTMGKFALLTKCVRVQLSWGWSSTLSYNQAQGVAVP